MNYLHIISSDNVETEWDFFDAVVQVVHSLVTVSQNKIDRLVKTFQGSLQKGQNWLNTWMASI